MKNIRNDQSMPSKSYVLVYACYILCAIFLTCNIIYQANYLPFSDQIDLFFGYLEGKNWLTLFMQQHGPHRQGFGALIMMPIISAADWDVSVLSYLTLFIMLIGTAFLILGMRARNIHIIPAATIVLLSLSFGSSELITVTPNVSHSALPVMLCFFIIFLLLRCTKLDLRIELLILIFSVFALFTGFGIFLFLSYSFIMCMGFVRDACVDRRAKIKYILLYIAAFLFMLGATIFFLTGYSSGRAEGCSATALLHILEVSKYVFATSSVALGGSSLGALAIGTGLVYFVALVIIGMLAVNKFFSCKDDSNRTILILVLISLSFVTNVAIGRFCLGLESAFASRYYPLASIGLIGILIAIDLWFYDRYPLVVNTISIAVALLTICLVFPLGAGISKAFYAHKVNFARCTESGRSVTECNAIYVIYPDSDRLEQAMSMIRTAKEK